MTAPVFKKRIHAVYHFTALVICLAIAFSFFTSIQVSKGASGTIPWRLIHA